MELSTELSTSPYGENKIKKYKRQTITLILFIIVVLFLDWQIYELINENRKSERLSFPKTTRYSNHSFSQYTTLKPTFKNIYRI
ncbi:hypothetical protein CleRT_14940 [Candidatus Coxiella mudrowiae]|uniref:Uncharacterized protein n=1 Tax=Candidatus Coxiella mudrowiae TaxID=2054173 RepID=A0ABN4HRR9_9COXI|nr:hypothetical protein CleRT_14940 [Candidatus Coxiella mudrowiae]